MDARFFVKVKRIERPSKQSFHENVSWLCRSFSLSTHNSSIAEQILEEILKSERGLSSTELSRRLNYSRSTVIHQLNKLIASGLIVKQGRLYRLRASSLELTLEEIFDDIEHAFRRLLRIAREIDALLKTKEFKY